MAQRLTRDWHSVERLQGNTMRAALVAALPGQWGPRVDLLAVPVANDPVWRRSALWLERLEAFKAQHGDALHWSLSDAQVCHRAKELAAWVSDLLALRPADCGDAERLDKVRQLCAVVGVDAPASITAAGAVARAECPTWWRRVLRRTVARVVEGGAIKLGVVNRKDGGYCSDDAVNRRGEQVRRNAAMMAGTLLRNEAGQVYTLAELAKTSTANPDIRGGELMTRIRGCEEHADASGHVGYFFTLTCPSRFHAVQSGGKGSKAKPRRNPRYDGASTPRDAQAWLRNTWAKTRAACAREGVQMYGFRVAEPHHDGCPHWHALLWFTTQAQADACQRLIGRYWLADGGAVVPVKRAGVMCFEPGDNAAHEPGALKNRVNIKRMNNGGAAGYVAKYVAKNIGHFDVGVHLDGLEVDTREVKGWQRVDAWAATWGIRQFQAIGQPSVTVWRELRRVTKEQVEAVRVAGDVVAWKAWGAVHRSGVIQACWRRYMEAQGGPCRKRGLYAIAPALRVTPGHVNGYGESLELKTIYGLSLPSGRCLVSRRQAWGRVADEARQDGAERARKGTPWTGFNNCTARLGGGLRAALLGLKRGRDGVDLPGCYGA